MVYALSVLIQSNIIRVSGYLNCILYTFHCILIFAA